MTKRSLKSTGIFAIACAGLLSTAAFGQASITGAGNDGDNGPAFQPSVTAVMPKAGPIGTKVTMKGINLSRVTAVRFQPNIMVKAKLINNNSIQVTVPAGAQSGPVMLETPDGFSNKNPVFNVTTAQ
jgi:hypothetical protein